MTGSPEEPGDVNHEGRQEHEGHEELDMTNEAGEQTTTHIAAVTVLGTGVLGSQIAYQTIYSGFDVVEYDINEEALTAAKKRFARLAATYKEQAKGAADGKADAPLKRITWQTDLGRAVVAAGVGCLVHSQRMDIFVVKNLPLTKRTSPVFRKG